MRRVVSILTLLLILLLSCNTTPREGRETVSGKNTWESRLQDSWSREGPELLWTYEGLGRGYGGPLIADEGIFINGEEGGRSYTICLDHGGTFRWKSPNGTTFTGVDFSASYPGTRSVPAIRGGLVYAISGMGNLSCFDHSGGQVVWSVDLVKDFQGIPGDFGYSAAPLVDARRVYCFAGGRLHNVVALDRETGELRWSSPVRQDYFSYDTPVLLNLPGREALAGVSRNYIYVLDRQDGKLLSSYRLEDIRPGFEHCNSVVYKDGYIYFVPESDQGQGSVKLQLSEDGTSLQEIWRNPGVVNVFEGFVVMDRYLYTTMENRKLLVLDTSTGHIAQAVRAESGTIAYADNKLIIYGHNGKVQLFGLRDGLPELRSEMRIRGGSGHHFSFPVIAGGVMYIRRGDALMAYRVGITPPAMN